MTDSKPIIMTALFNRLNRNLFALAGKACKASGRSRYLSFRDGSRQLQWKTILSLSAKHAGEPILFGVPATPAPAQADSGVIPSSEGHPAESTAIGN